MEKHRSATDVTWLSCEHTEEEEVVEEEEVQELGGAPGVWEIVIVIIILGRRE